MGVQPVGHSKRVSYFGKGHGCESLRQLQHLSLPKEADKTAELDVQLCPSPVAALGIVLKTQVSSQNLEQCLA